MKRVVIWFLCVCLLLSGCGIGSPDPLQTESTATEIPATETSAAETSVEEAPSISLLDQGVAQEDNNNLLYIPNETIEEMANPEMCLFGNGLLLGDYRENEWMFYHISLEDGTVIASGSVPASPDTKMCVGSGEIGLCDREVGVITILDETFQIRRTYDVANDGDEWYLNSELDTLYIFFSDRGLMAHNLESGEDLWLVDNGFRVTPVSSGSGYVVFTYTDRADQKTYLRCMNLSAATLETLPVGGVAEATRQGDTWLIRDSETDGLYNLVHGETAHSFYWSDSAVQLLADRGDLLATDISGRNLLLYERDGAFLSQCALIQNSNAMVGADFVWSDICGGYFFTDHIESVCRLMFWDVSVAAEGEDLEMSSPEQNPPAQPMLDAQLYDRAAQLSQRFGVDIRIGEQCTMDYTHYETYVLTDPDFIRSNLDVLEQSLEKYPEGFFRQLCYGSIESVRFELVGGLMAKDGVDSHSGSIGGFAQNMGSYYLIALDGFLMQPQTLFHELSHVIDKRLEWDSLIREEALYSEAAWLALQPEGFGYALSYTQIPEELRWYMQTESFVSEYALTFPTEDRATLITSAMENHSWDFEPGMGRREKLQYYAACIRDCFDTTGWPEITVWEQVLQ